MATFVSLVNWTDQGIRNYKDTTQRAAAFAASLEKLGAKLLAIYWTVGPHDIVAIVEAPDDETATAGLLQIGGVGNVRSVTMRAFGTDEMNAIIARTTG